MITKSALLLYQLFARYAWLTSSHRLLAQQFQWSLWGNFIFPSVGPGKQRAGDERDAGDERVRDERVRDERVRDERDAGDREHAPRERQIRTHYTSTIEPSTNLDFEETVLAENQLHDRAPASLPQLAFPRMKIETIEPAHY